MTDTANAPWRTIGIDAGGADVTFKTEWVTRTHCDELVAAAYLDAAENVRIRRYNSWGDFDYSPLYRRTQEGIKARTPDNARAALTAYGERMKAEGARDAQAKIARLAEALDEKQDGGKDFWMKWTQKRLEINRAMFLRDAKMALAGDMRALRNRVELMEAEPVPLVLSAALQENANE